MLHTNTLITTLTDTHSSEFNRAESLATLIKHNYFVSIKEDLKVCYFTEHYHKARLLIDKVMFIRDGKAKQGETIYTLTRNSIIKNKADSRQTLGMAITCYGGSSSWSVAIDIMSRINFIHQLESNPSFNLRHSKLKNILKRKARLSKVRLSKKGTTTKYKRREAPIPPSSKS